MSLVVMSTMNGGPPTISTTTETSTFKAIFDNALEEYKKKTGTNLTTHPLANDLQTCDSPDAILTYFKYTYGHTKSLFQPSAPTPQRWSNSVEPPGVQASKSYFRWILCPSCWVYHPKILDTGSLIHISQTAKASRASHNAFIDLFELVGSFLKRLKIYSGIPLTTKINELFGRIMVEILSIHEDEPGDS
ncbi:hypothetical protein EDB89DRAFT_2068714 [Lactarius sanguifluus]|nr:hypothetical protein EDB89DRAFT_2068714 [Lactarius sanguifluus]